MTWIVGLALVVLGLFVGGIVGWALGTGLEWGLAIGLLLAVAGGVVGFVVEWLIDEAYRKNRELRRLLSQGSGTALAVGAGMSVPNGDSAAQTLADFLHRRDEELQEVRERLSAADVQLDRLRERFETYQRTHPDDLTVIRGVGPVYQWRLRDIGVNTYAQLAASDADQLRRMLNVRGWQRANVDSWIEQARDWAQREP